MSSILFLAVNLCACHQVCSWDSNKTTSTSSVLSENIGNLTNRTPRRCDNFTADITPPCIDDESLVDNSTINTICNVTEQRDDDNGTCEDDPPKVSSSSTANTVIKYLGHVTVPLFLALSLTGNGLTLIVMFSKKFWNSPCSFLLIALAVSDATHSIVVPFSKIFYRDLIGYDPRALTEAGCHVFFIIHKSSKMASSWFIVVICIERFIAVWFPLRVKLICSKRKSMAAVLVITTGLLIFNGFWTFANKIVNGVCITNYSTPETAILARAYLLAASVISSLIPAIILIILTPAICAKLHHQSKLRQKLCNKVNEKDSETSRVNAMLVAVSIAYIILVAPIAIAQNVCFTLGINFYESKVLSLTIIRTTLKMMEQLNFFINFWLYVMCNRSFRHRVSEILTCTKWRRVSRTSSSTSQTYLNTTRRRVGEKSDFISA